MAKKSKYGNCIGCGKPLVCALGIAIYCKNKKCDRMDDQRPDEERTPITISSVEYGLSVTIDPIQKENIIPVLISSDGTTIVNTFNPNDQFVCDENHILVSIPRPDNIVKMTKAEAEPILKKWEEARAKRLRKMKAILLSMNEAGTDGDVSLDEDILKEMEIENDPYLDYWDRLSKTLLEYLDKE